MRILGFSKEWDKLKGSFFTTFRVPRKDKDWQLYEKVQIVIKPRTKERKILGEAVIIGKEERSLEGIDLHEAVIDGFPSLTEMKYWLIEAHGKEKLDHTPLNKLTLNWQQGAQ